MVEENGYKIDIESVSKCKIEVSNLSKKNQMSQLLANLQFIDNLDMEYEAPTLIRTKRIFQKQKQQQKQQQTNEYNQQSEKPTKQTIKNLNDIIYYFANSINIQNKNKQVQQQSYKLRNFQDSNLTKHLSQQIIILKILMMVIGVLSIFLSSINEEILLFQSQYADRLTASLLPSQVVLICHSLLTVSLVFFHIIKHLSEKQLSDKQLIKFSEYQLSPYGITPPFLLQMLLLLIHPNYACINVTFQFQQPVHNQYFTIIMLTRIYLLYLAIIKSSMYMSTRGNRVCRIYGTKSDLIFGMKCVFNDRPLTALLVIFISLLIVFANMVRLSEYRLRESQLGRFVNSIWCVMITMGTIGYGDYYPQTYLGRFIIFMASISGIILSSLLILTLSTYLSMQLSQNKAHITLQRLALRQKMQKYAQDVIMQTATISKNTNFQSPQQKQIALKDLKKKSENVKYTMRKIKNFVDTNNINEEMDRLFESLGDNMKEAYVNQCKYAESLIQFAKQEEERIEQMRFSFTEEIENIIREK